MDVNVYSCILQSYHFTVHYMLICILKISKVLNMHQLTDKEWYSLVSFFLRVSRNATLCKFMHYICPSFIPLKDVSQQDT